MKLLHALRVLLIACALFSVAIPFAHADTPAEIQAKIDIQNQKIKELEAEIARFEADLVEIGKNKSTLQSEVNRIDTSRKKITADISKTQSKISAANLELEELGTQILDKEGKIDLGKRAIQESLRSLKKAGDTTLVEHFFSSDNDLASAWTDADMLTTLQSNLRTEVDLLSDIKRQLGENRDKVTVQKSQLSSLKTSLNGQKTVLDENRKEQATLLTETKNKETEYQKLLETKRQAKIQFEQELNQYESQLKFTLDPSSIPTVATGVLQFPIDPTFMARCKDRSKAFGNVYCMTQPFGDTAFARSGAYNGSGHNGIDFGTPEGTQIVAALSGVVVATGNTDAYKGCYSYGKWVLVKHNNGLSSLYAHLSVISVGQGDALPTGGLIGYSGKTGYATGPHLHFTLYVSDAVKVIRLGEVKAKTNCSNALVPVAPTSAYLNPMSYF